MTIEFLDDEAIADIAFIVRSPTMKGVFLEACNAVLGLQTDLSLLDNNLRVEFNLNASSWERLLHHLLAEIVYVRDADFMFGKSVDLELSEKNGTFTAKGAFIGEEINLDKHIQGNEVKAITMHDFYLKESNQGWEAYVLVDI